VVADRAKAKILMTDSSRRDARYHGLNDVVQFTLKGAGVELVEGEARRCELLACTKHGDTKIGVKPLKTTNSAKSPIRQPE
jgi:hypothetical protein